MRKIVLAVFFLFSVVLGASADSGILKKVSPSTNSLRQYQTLRIKAKVKAEYKSPFDTDEIDIKANIIAPDGKSLAIPAFYTGKTSSWEVRYTPAQAGRYSYSLSAKNKSGTETSDMYYLDVKKGSGNGFVRKAENNTYLVFDSGKPFFGIGHNIAWVTDSKLSIYKKYFSLLKEHDCNLARIWINTSWGFPIEIGKIGNYSISSFNELDELVNLAEEYGIYILLVLDTYGTLMSEEGPWGENAWSENPYNKANGGPCEEPWDFFENETAKKHYKNRLRYIISRYSYSPHIMAFELWNEVDVPADWAEGMFRFVKSINPHGQLVTISLGYPWSNNFDESLIWSEKNLDIIERHVYGNDSGDAIGYLISTNKEMLKKYKKPILIGEFGMDSGRKDQSIDREGKGIALHNSIWSATTSGACSSALNWWWAGYIKAKNLYHNYYALSRFVSGVNWNSKSVDFVKTSPAMHKKSEKGTILYYQVVIPVADKWGNTDYGEFLVDNNGDVSGGVLNRFLHGYTKKQFQVEPVFHVNYPVDGKFIIDIATVSQGATLVIFLDEKEELRREFPAGPGEGPWKKSLYRKDHNVYQCVYNVSVEIDVPAGEHTIRLANTGKDWIGLKKIALTNYMSDSFANARVTGVRLDEEIILWIQNKSYNWRNSSKGAKFPVISGASFKIFDVPGGTYSIEWWDTFKGEVVFREKAKAENNTLKLSIPDFDKDIACKISAVSIKD